MTERLESLPIEDATLRQVHRKFVTGVTVVTTMADSQPRGLAVNAFTSISLDPPLTLVCINKSSNTFNSLFQSQYIGINVLSHHQGTICRWFASKRTDKFADIDWVAGEYGSPLLAQCCAWMEARVLERLDAHTHVVFVCEVVGAACTSEPPLIYSNGGFFDGAYLAPVEEVDGRDSGTTESLAGRNTE